MQFKMSSAICFNLDQSKILSSCKGLKKNVSFIFNPDRDQGKGPTTRNTYVKYECSVTSKVIANVKVPVAPN